MNQINSKNETIEEVGVSQYGNPFFQQNLGYGNQLMPPVENSEYPMSLYDASQWGSNYPLWASQPNYWNPPSNPGPVYYPTHQQAYTGDFAMIQAFNEPPNQTNGYSSHPNKQFHEELPPTFWESPICKASPVQNANLNQVKVENLDGWAPKNAEAPRKRFQRPRISREDKELALAFVRHSDRQLHRKKAIDLIQKRQIEAGLTPTPDYQLLSILRARDSDSWLNLLKEPSPESAPNFKTRSEYKHQLVESDEDDFTPRVAGNLKSYLLQFIKLPMDLERPLRESVVAIQKRMVYLSGWMIEKEVIRKLLYNIRRDQRERFREYNERLFKDLNWDFQLVLEINDVEMNVY